jgi:hypothetical protein
MRREGGRGRFTDRNVKRNLESENRNENELDPRGIPSTPTLFSLNTPYDTIVSNPTGLSAVFRPRALCDVSQPLVL